MKASVRFITPLILSFSRREPPFSGVMADFVFAIKSRSRDIRGQRKMTRVFYSAPKFDWCLPVHVERGLLQLSENELHAVCLGQVRPGLPAAVFARPEY